MISREEAYQEQFQRLEDKLSRIKIPVLLATENVSTTESVNVNAKKQKAMYLTYQLGQLCTKYEKHAESLPYYEKVLAWIHTHPLLACSESSLHDHASDATAAALAELHVGTLNNMAVAKYCLDNVQQAITYILAGKKVVRAEISKGNLGITTQEPMLNSNYALYLFRQGNLKDAMHTASTMLDCRDAAGLHPSEHINVTKAGATSRLLRIGQTKLTIDRVKEVNIAVEEAERCDDQELLCVAYNNKGVVELEVGNEETALICFSKALQANGHCHKTSIQGLIMFHLGVLLGRSSFSTRMLQSAGLHPSITAEACLKQSEVSRSTDSRPDMIVRLLIQCERARKSYEAKQFHTSEAELSFGLQGVDEILCDELEAENCADRGSLLKLKGMLISWFGQVHFAQGKVDDAVKLHYIDLQMATEQEDIPSQQRATHNLALVYSASQRYMEAIPLWREAVNIATTLQRPQDMLEAYAGLGRALKHLHLRNSYHTVHPKATEMLEKKENDIRYVFEKQRAIAKELDNIEETIEAQRNLVHTFELPKYAQEIEDRLVECSTFITLCEMHLSEASSLRGEAYWCVANALTSQIIRLRSLGGGFRVMEALNALTQKRKLACNKYMEWVESSGAGNNLWAATNSTVEEPESDDGDTDSTFGKMNIMIQQ